MTKYIEKSALVAEIEKRKNMFYDMSKGCEDASSAKAGFYAQALNLEGILSFLDTLEVKDANEALRTEYEKGRADVIADTLSWLENCWPKYCSNQTIIEGFKEAMKE